MYIFVLRYESKKRSIDKNMVIIKEITEEKDSIPTKIQFRPATLADVAAMMEIIHQAQEALKVLGVNQWQNGYPTPDIIRQDIRNGNACVLTDGDAVIATSAVIFNDEPTYDRIYEGEWLSTGEFVVVHRIAVDNRRKQKGTASCLFREVEKMALQKNIHSFKIDTHKDNVPMRKALEKNGFSYCGRIILRDGNDRVAYEKRIEE
ncbi:MAG: GNAT family N-acetyltransferase [Tannerella sp.]|jgi:RimJ/RimL family protein N-acetyltransferase|nr:GNAT family N-acetyltransferase [Tannerella sp.]